MIMSVPVHVELAASDQAAASSQPVATECPACYAIVLKARVAEHQRAAHGKAAE